MIYRFRQGQAWFWCLLSEYLSEAQVWVERRYIAAYERWRQTGGSE